MRLKVLILPFLIVMILILLIGFIKPDLDVMQTKKTDIFTKEEAVANMDTVLANADALSGSLDTQSDLEKFAYRYLPSSQNQEQVIDNFNFLATQSGVVITKMELKQPLTKVAIENFDASGVPIVSTSPEMKTFAFSGNVKGSYENIKAFFDRLVHMERLEQVNLFSIETNTTVQPLDTNQLMGTFQAEFGYLPARTSVSALDMPIFRRSKFDFSNVNTLLEQSKDVIPSLEKGQTGRPNPFQ